MSHTSTYKHKIKEVNRLVNIAAKLGYAVRAEDKLTVHHFSRNSVSAEVAIMIPGWKYEIAIKKDGEILYDHWGSEANSFQKLGELVQTYNKELIANSIPYSEIEGFNSVVEKNGDFKMILEYA